MPSVPKSPKNDTNFTLWYGSTKFNYGKFERELDEITAAERQNETNLQDVEERIGRTCEESGRNRADVRLIAVTKGRSCDEIKTLYEMGIRDFGESRWQEARGKQETLPGDIRWHFIGALQSNKAKAIAQHFEVIHSLTNCRQIAEIEKANSEVDGLVELNLTNETQKTGLPVNLLDETVDCVVKCNLTRFRGLMTIGPRFGG